MQCRFGVILTVSTVFAASCSGTAWAAGSPPVPELQAARDYLHDHTDINCDTRGNPNLERKDNVVVMSQFEDMKTVIFDLYCDNSGPQTTRVFLKWKTFNQRFELLHFAQPVFDIVYKSEEARIELAQPVVASGYDVLTAIENAVLDPSTRTIVSQVPWGLQGDAGIAAVWQWSYAAERFSLVSYVIDPFHESDLNPPGGPELKDKTVRLFPPQ